MSRRRRGGARAPGRLWVAAAAACGLVVVAFFAIRTGSEAPLPAAPALPETPSVRVRVEVLNGGGVPGAARRATDLARSSGFDVVFFGNASVVDLDGSEVVDRVGRPELAAAVAEALGIPNVRSEPDPERYVDVSVILGSRWQVPATSEVTPEP